MQKKLEVQKTPRNALLEKQHNHQEENKLTFNITYNQNSKILKQFRKNYGFY